MNSNFGLVDPLPDAPRDKEKKRALLVERARADFARWMEEHEMAPVAAAR
jgi:folate-dependent tRNA-U54 methylase TrmFO/GidA